MCGETSKQVLAHCSPSHLTPFLQVCGFWSPTAGSLFNGHLSVVLSLVPVLTPTTLPHPALPHLRKAHLLSLPYAQDPVQGWVHTDHHRVTESCTCLSGPRGAAEKPRALAGSGFGKVPRNLQPVGRAHRPALCRHLTPAFFHEFGIWAPSG